MTQETVGERGPEPDAGTGPASVSGMAQDEPTNPASSGARRPGPRPLPLTEAPLLAAADPSDQQLLVEAHHRRQQRQARDLAFGDCSDVFRDPAWEMILALFIAGLQGRRVSALEIAREACVPQTTAFRCLEALIERGLVARGRDRLDRRRTIVALSETAAMAMRSLLTRSLGRSGA